MRQRVPGFHGAVIALIALGPPATAEDCNSNGVEDREEIAARFVRDCNSNGIPDHCEPRTLLFLFLHASTPSCLDAADATDNGKLDISDGNSSSAISSGEPGSEILPPGPFACGLDPTGDGLDCADFTACP